MSWLYPFSPPWVLAVLALIGVAILVWAIVLARRS